MKIKNPILFFILIAFIIVNIVDSVTAFFILPGEANPLYILTGNIFIVIGIKILFIFIAIYYYNRNIFPSNLTYYFFMIMLVLSTLMIGIAAHGNIQGIKHPEIVEMAKNVPNVEKVQNYFWFVGFIYYLPLLFSFISFILYDKSLKYVRIDKEYYKRKKWWQP